MGVWVGRDSGRGRGRGGVNQQQRVPTPIPAALEKPSRDKGDVALPAWHVSCQPGKAASLAHLVHFLWPHRAQQQHQALYHGRARYRAGHRAAGVSGWETGQKLALGTYPDPAP